MTLNKLTHAIALTVAAGIITGCGSSGNNKEEVIVEEKTIEEKIVEAANARLTEDDVPGLSIALVGKDGILYSKGFGLANIESQIPVTKNTSFWLGSTSKAVMGSAIVKLMEDSSLTLDTPINPILQSQANFQLDYEFADQITMEHLVTHQSGIRDSDYYDCVYFAGDENGPYQSLYNLFYDSTLCDESVPMTLEAYMEHYLDQDGVYYSADNFLAQAPGERYQYSNVGSALAGHVFELVAGHSLRDYARNEIFSRLGMPNTSWYLDELNTDSTATQYPLDDDGSHIALPHYSIATWPDGGLRSSANDLATFLQTIMNQGSLVGETIWQPESVNLLTNIRDNIPAGGLNHGVFWYTATNYAGRTVVGHAGSDPGAFSFMFFDQEKEVGVVIMGNGDDERAGFENNFAIFMEELFQYAEDLQNQ